MKDNLQQIVFHCRVTFSHSCDTKILKIHLELSKLQTVEVYMHDRHETN